MVHNQHITASDLLLQRQIASDDKRGNEGGIYDTGANGQRRRVSSIYPRRKTEFTFVYLMITGEIKVRFMTLS